jgi:dihydrofolate reductase
MHTSLDGFVAGPNGEMDWINVDDELFDFAITFPVQADMALYGRVTYQMMESYWPTAADQPAATKHDIEHSRWYNSVAKIVLSKTIGQTQSRNTTFLADNISEHINRVKQEAGKNILMFGSPTAVHILSQHNLIDDYWLFVNPILLGSGIPMFADITKRKQLSLLATRVFSSGVIGLHYEKKP